MPGRRRPDTPLEPRSSRRREAAQQPRAPEFDQHHHVEEVHCTKHDHGEADLGAEKLDRLDRVGWLGAVFEGKGDEADVDQIEADEEQMIDRVRKRLVAFEILDQKYPAVAIQRASDPDRNRQADHDVSGIGGDHHCSPSFPVVYGSLISYEAKYALI